MTRFDKIKDMDLDDLAVVCSFNFNCDVCGAKTKDCFNDCSFCIDAMRDWLNSEGDVF